VPTGKLDGSIDARIWMSALFRRSFCQLYHSLTDDPNVAPVFTSDGCDRFSALSVTAVGPQVFDLNRPVARKVLLNHGPRAWADPLSHRAVTQ
jgi:hypothetical protein